MIVWQLRRPALSIICPFTLLHCTMHRWAGKPPPLTTVIQTPAIYLTLRRRIKQRVAWRAFRPTSGFCLTLLSFDVNLQDDCTLHLRSDATFIVFSQWKQCSMITSNNKAWKLNDILPTAAFILIYRVSSLFSLRDLHTSRKRVTCTCKLHKSFIDRKTAQLLWLEKGKLRSCTSW